MSTQNGTQNDAYNTPSKPTSNGASGGRNQKDRRYTDTFYDQHRNSVRFPNGRPWCGQREIAANRDAVPLPHDGFIGSLTPGAYIEDDGGIVDRVATFGSIWNAPWTPIEKFFRFNYQRKTIQFDYARMRMEEQQGLDVYYEAAALMGGALNIRVDYGIVPHFQITAKIGRPSKMLAVADAAMAGDPWLLGFKDEVNPLLANILGYTERGLKRVTSFVPEAASPLITPAEVIATPQDELLKRLAELEAQLASMTAEKQKKSDQMANARAARKTAKPAEVATV